jgi:hypothetical protein
MTRAILGLAAFLALTLGAMPVRACINDRAVKQAEQEFKSQYKETAPDSEPYSHPSTSPGQVTSVIFLGGGAALLVGATLTVLIPGTRPRPS